MVSDRDYGVANMLCCEEKIGVFILATHCNNFVTVSAVVKEMAELKSRMSGSRGGWRLICPESWRRPTVRASMEQIQRHDQSQP